MVDQAAEIQRLCSICQYPMLTDREVHLVCDLDLWKRRAERWHNIARLYHALLITYETSRDLLTMLRQLAKR